MLAWVLLLGLVSGIECGNLQYGGKNGMPKNFVECVENDLFIAEAMNLTNMEVQIFCKDLLVAQLEERTMTMKNLNVTNYIKHLLRGITAEMTSDKSSRNKRSIFGGGTVLRREVREPPYHRNFGCFARGVQRLKHDFSVNRAMNTYDVICSLHSGASIPVAHNGPGFFGWHRAFIRIMEFAIGCPIPYWDTTIDFAIADPTKSSLWTHKYFGNGYGLVTTGPFAGLPGTVPIVRNINAGGWLISNRDIDMTLAKPNFAQFTEPSPCDGANRELYSFECLHDGTHVWLDGTINTAETAPLDPIFFPFHAFVDKVFQMFKRKLGSNLVYPETGIPGQSAHDRMLFYDAYPGIEPITHLQGIGDALDSLINYSDKPRCPSCSESPDLVCERERNMCVPRIRQGMDAMARDRMVMQTNAGMQMVDVMVPDMPERSENYVARYGPLPLPGRRFHVRYRDSRTMGTSMPVM